jgi:hypothetical protein
MDRKRMASQENGTVSSCALVWTAAMVVVSAALSPPALGAQTDITISTAAAPATPRILGPSVLGSVPGSPFLYGIPATGQAPLKFEATGLPTGLAIDATSGVISGTTPTAATYPITVTVSNGSGSASRTLTLTAGSTLALTPPMGWNSYDSFSASVTEKDVLDAAKAMKTLLQPYGWNTVVIDYLWYDPEDTIDANGRWLPSRGKYPSATGADGFKSIATQVHALGLTFGIHLMRGIPRKSVSPSLPIADSSSTTSQAGNTSDTCSWDSHMYGVKGDTDAGQAWYDSIYKQYADWGVDFAKVDDMMNPYGGNVLHTSEVVAVHNSIVKTGRSIILSLSPGPNQTKDVTTLNANANMWRQVNDFWDTNGLSSMSDEFTAAYNWSTTAGVTPGHWPDADMLPLGTIGNRACAFSHNQQVMVMSLWAIMPSPLIFGGMPTKLSNDAWTLALLTNDEVLAVNQDALGARGKRVSQSGTSEVWAKDLADGRKAVALFNRATQDATIAVTFTQLGLTGTPAVRDLWNRKDVTDMTSGISVNVPHEAALMYVVGTPSVVATGGASGAGGGAGGGGSPGTGNGGAHGGAGGSAGAAGGGGTTSSGGASGGPGGMGGLSAGGASAAGGAASGGSNGRGGNSAGGTVGSGGAGSGGAGGNMTNGAGGSSAGSSAGPKTTSSGCSLGREGSRSASLLWACAALLLAGHLRRRKS